MNSGDNFDLKLAIFQGFSDDCMDCKVDICWQKCLDFDLAQEGRHRVVVPLLEIAYNRNFEQ